MAARCRPACSTKLVGKPVEKGRRERSCRPFLVADPPGIGPSDGRFPAQGNLDGRSNRYAALDVSLPLPCTPLTLSGALGIEDGAFGDRKRDWSLGLSGEIAGFALGASYVDTARADAGRLGRAGLALFAGRSF
ncbi:TorF family putative porin [uncultured Sphingomonas sp.]|uniref:TorF family putative porin n=1 Tax=uncultured Sphingomonas sp. TaxID=158754 RepID=UPI0025E1B9CE|nr:TorF family putative porin [uncultured Sphingomonas sp.]